jgi:replication factor C small subunit
MELDLWTEKYRPKTLSEIIGQESVVQRLMRFVENGAVPHCLFAGPPGTSKTTAGMAMARDLFGNTFGRNFMELNASDERGIDVVRNQIKSFARSIPSGDAPFKILVLDEADHLTGDAQHALRRTMESYASSCRMILICNYSSRIIPPIQSRCAVFKFSPLDDEAIVERLEYIADAENVSTDKQGIEAILYLANGDMRAAINLLQAASSTGEKVTGPVVYSISGRASPKEVRGLLTSSSEGKYEEAITSMKSLIYENGVSPIDLIRQIHRELLGLDMSKKRTMSTLEKAAEAEFRISEGASGEIQLAALLAYIGLENNTDE